MTQMRTKKMDVLFHQFSIKGSFMMKKICQPPLQWTAGTGAFWKIASKWESSKI